MARAIVVASGTGDVQVVPAGGSTVVGFTVAATAAALVFLRNGTTTGDPAVAVVRCPAGATVHVALPAVDCPAGVFLDRDGTNAADVAVYVL